MTAPARVALGQVADWTGTWGVPHVAAAVVGAPTPPGPGVPVAVNLLEVNLLEVAGPTDREFRLASVTKLLTAYAVLVAIEEEAITLDEPAGPAGATVRHLLAHAAGYGFASDAGVLAPPGTRRLYSNRGIEVLVAHLERACGISFPQYLAEAVLAPLGMARTALHGSPASDATSTVEDLTRFATELMAPALLHPETLAQAVTVQFPGLSGVLPGLGRFDPLDWGLGFELNFSRPKHWAGGRVSPATFGHFGAAGTFLWVDPLARVACVCLTDLDFGDWARAAWPPLGDEVIDVYGEGRMPGRAERDGAGSST